MDHAVKRGRWKVIGNISSVASPEDDPPPRFIQDPLDKTKFSIYLAKSEMLHAKSALGWRELRFGNPST
jgi:hypothetical protein